MLAELGFSERDIPAFAKGVAPDSQFLCGDQFPVLLQAEIDSRKQAQDLAKQFASTKSSKSSGGQRRSSSRSGGRGRLPFAQSAQSAQFQSSYQSAAPSWRPSQKSSSGGQGSSNRGSASRGASVRGGQSFRGDRGGSSGRGGHRGTFAKAPPKGKRF